MNAGIVLPPAVKLEENGRPDRFRRKNALGRATVFAGRYRFGLSSWAIRASRRWLTGAASASA